MILNSLAKVGIGASTLGGAIYLGDTLLDNSGNGKLLSIQAPADITSIDDIELLEASNRCAFWFVDSWDRGRTFKARKFLEELNGDKNYYKEKMLTAVKEVKAHCKPDAVFSFSHNPAAKAFYKTERIIK